jgi:ketosteroid isomerase-like protein
MNSASDAAQTVRTFWSLMATNDFHAVGAVLTEDFVLEWPQSNERILGARNFALMNAEYPSHGAWTFTVNRLVANDHQVVTDVSVTDGIQQARAVSFFTIREGKICQIVEYWPDTYEAPYDRTHLVESIA